MCLMHLRYRSEVKIFKIFTTFALSFFSLNNFGTKLMGLQPPPPSPPCLQSCQILSDFRRKYLVKQLPTLQATKAVANRHQESNIQQLGRHSIYQLWSYPIKRDTNSHKYQSHLQYLVQKLSKRQGPHNFYGRLAWNICTGRNPLPLGK